MAEDFKRATDIKKLEREGMFSPSWLADAAAPLAMVSDPERRTRHAKKVGAVFIDTLIKESDDRVIRDYRDKLVKKEIDTRQKEVTHDIEEKELFEHHPLPAEERERLNELDIQLTSGEEAEAVAKSLTNEQMIEQKREKIIERKTHLYRRDKELELRRMVDKAEMWRIGRMFFLDATGVTHKMIDEHLLGGFLETFEGEMRAFLLGVGWNQDLINDMYDPRRKLVDEAREILAKNRYGEHYTEFLEASTESQFIIHAFTAKFSDKEEVKKQYKEWQLKAFKEDFEMTDGDFDGLEDDLKTELDERARILFKGEFKELGNEDKKLCLVNTDEILPLGDILKWMMEYKARPLHGEETIEFEEFYKYSWGEWKEYGLVEEVGPWRLADEIMSIVYSYAFRLDPPRITRDQVEGLRSSFAGVYSYFDLRRYYAFYGRKDKEGRDYLPYELSAGPGDEKVSWQEGYLNDLKKEREKEWQEDRKKFNFPDEWDFSNWVMWKYDIIAEYKQWAMETYYDYWRDVAEAATVFRLTKQIKLHLAKGGNKDDIINFLDDQIDQGNLSEFGKKVLKERTFKEDITFWDDVREILKIGHAFGVPGEDEKDKVKYKLKWREAWGHLWWQKAVKPVLGTVKRSGQIKKLLVGGTALYGLVFGWGALVGWGVGATALYTTLIYVYEKYGLMRMTQFENRLVKDQAEAKDKHISFRSGTEPELTGHFKVSKLEEERINTPPKV